MCCTSVEDAISFLGRLPLTVSWQSVEWSRFVFIFQFFLFLHFVYILFTPLHCIHTDLLSYPFSCFQTRSYIVFRLLGRRFCVFGSLLSCLDASRYNCLGTSHDCAFCRRGPGHLILLAEWAREVQVEKNTPPPPPPRHTLNHVEV